MLNVCVTDWGGQAWGGGRGVRKLLWEELRASILSIEGGNQSEGEKLVTPVKLLTACKVFFSVVWLFCFSLLSSNEAGGASPAQLLAANRLHTLTDSRPPTPPPPPPQMMQSAESGVGNLAAIWMETRCNSTHDSLWKTGQRSKVKPAFCMFHAKCEKKKIG